jgi:hypothetical protein
MPVTIDLRQPPQERWLLNQDASEGLRELADYYLNDLGVDDEYLAEMTNQMLALIPRSTYLDELRGIAQQTGLSLDQLMAFNLYYDLTIRSWVVRLLLHKLMRVSCTAETSIGFPPTKPCPGTASAQNSSTARKVRSPQLAGLVGSVCYLVWPKTDLPSPSTQSSVMIRKTQMVNRWLFCCGMCCSMPAVLPKRLNGCQPNLLFVTVCCWSAASRINRRW